MDLQFEREVMSFDQNVALAEMEAAKAVVRVRELQYQKTRYCLEYFLAAQKAMQQQAQGPVIDGVQAAQEATDATAVA